MISETQITNASAKSSRLPTSTVAQHRVRLFQPTRRPKAQGSQMVKTNFGMVTVTGRLGQGHADLLEYS